MNVALGNGSIDGTTIIEPIASRAVGEGYAARWRSWADVHPNDTMSTMMYSQAFAESNTEAARRWAKAYIRGLRDYHGGAFVQCLGYPSHRQSG